MHRAHRHGRPPARERGLPRPLAGRRPGARAARLLEPARGRHLRHARGLGPRGRGAEGPAGARPRAPQVPAHVHREARAPGRERRRARGAALRRALLQAPAAARGGAPRALPAAARLAALLLGADAQGHGQRRPPRERAPHLLERLHGHPRRPPDAAGRLLLDHRHRGKPELVDLRRHRAGRRSQRRRLALHRAYALLPGFAGVPSGVRLEPPLR
mmetsp:Transcript_62573/g.177737  ORF Transcript_62573/g.177737 Transcript_62573/m.177737 type:complete len:215 (+) Transcript_62573:531-1175(+)